MSRTDPSPASSSVVNTKFLVKHAFGSHVTKIDSIQSFPASSGGKDSSDRLVYKVGKQVCIFDVEGGKQEYFDSRAKNVTDVVHFTISANSRFISMCEKVGEISSHITVYSLSTLSKLKTLNHSSAKSYVCSTFCGDPKMIAALTGDADRQIIVWYWEKEKFYKSILINTNAMNVNLLRAAPSATIMLTTTGPNCLKYWCLGADGNLKAGQFLPPSKEGLENFVDHLWLPSALGQHRLIVLADPDSGNDSRAKRQTLFVFEGNDDNPVAHLGSISANNPTAPINMELRQAINLKLEVGGRVEKIVPTSKAFMLVGLFGLVCTYERTDDKHEPYTEARRISLGDVHIIGATVPPSEERLVLVTKAGRMLSMSLDMTMEQLKISAGLAEDNEGSDASGDNDSNTVDTITNGDKNGVGGVTDLTTGGFHCQPIIAADLAYDRSLMVTISADNTCRLWNYLTMKCELVHNFRAEEPIAVSIHANGFQLLVSFKDRIRMYNVLMDKLKMAKETILKNCKCLKFSNGSQYFAAATAINVVIYETRSFCQLTTFQGHMMTVVKLSWAPGDQVVFSAGMDGNIYGWPIAKEGRIDVIAASNRSSAILDMEVDSPSTVFPVAPKQYEDDAPSALGGSHGSSTSAVVSSKGSSSQQQTAPVPSLDRHTLIVATLDGYIRMPNWTMQVNLKHKGHSDNNRASLISDQIHMLPGDPSCCITAMQLSHDRKRLFCGTSIGTLRMYAWPPVLSPQASTGSGKDANLSHLYYEIYTHSSKVVAIRLTPTDNCVISAAEDGSVFVHSIVEERVKSTPHSDGGDKSASSALSSSSQQHATTYDLFEVEDVITLNNDVVLMSVEDIEDHVSEVVELQKQLSETRAKNDFHTRKLESDHNEALKKMNDMHDITTNKEKESFEKQRATFDRRIRELIVSMEQKETDHIKIVTELENKYEHKLADQLERYDMLHEKMQLLKQKCEGLLEAEKANFQKQLVDLKDAAKTREKSLQVKHRRAVEDKSANESAFKEIINQQEDEYEDELRQLIHAAESELVSERETILKLRTLVQTKKTKIDQLEKKLQELSVASKARLVLLNQERVEKQKLVDTIEHYKKNLVEREDALAEKEKMVLELRSTTRTLENFRFVLDHRLQQLSSERGPITSHIEGLEKHISTMYEELVEEFSAKKTSAEAASLKDQKIVWISQDLNKMRSNVREKEQYIAAFKRELGNVVSSMTVGKELEESVKMLYKKFVRGENVSKSLSKLNDNVAEKVDTIMNVKDSDDQSILSMDTYEKGFKGGPMRGASDSVVKEVEEALVETAKEADRQKKFVERQSDNLKHRLSCVQREAHMLGRHRLNENSTLLYECNELRTEVKDLKRKLEIKKNALEMAERSVDQLNAQLTFIVKHPETALTGAFKTLGHSRTGTPAAAASKTQQRIGEAMAQLQSDPLYQQQQQQLMATAAAENTSKTQGQWVVHNSLLPKTTAGGGGTMTNIHEQESLHSLHGNAVPLAVSQSAPQLDPLDGRTSPLNKRNLGHGGVTGGHARISMSATQLNVDPKTAPGGAKLLSLNIPRAGVINKKAATGSHSIVGNPSSWQTEKLAKEVDSLAFQLDESQRERDMQRIELSRLRKQLMALSTSGVAANQSHSPLHSHSLVNQTFSGGNSLIYHQQNSNSMIQLPSIIATQDSVTSYGSQLQQPSQQLQQSSMRSGGGLTNADLYGVPSEQDKRDMRLAPTSSILSSGSGRSKNTVGSHKSQQQQQQQQQQHTVVGSPIAKLARGNSNTSTRTNKSNRSGSNKPINTTDVKNNGGRDINDLHELSLQSSMSVEEDGDGDGDGENENNSVDNGGEGVGAGAE